MKRRSFRLRLALISMGISGLVLIVFGLIASWSLSHARSQDLDRELSNFGFRFASRSGPGVNLKRQEETLTSLVGTAAEPYRFFSILNRSSNLVSSSQRWPSSLDPTIFAPGEKHLDPQPDFVPVPPKPGVEKPPRMFRAVFEPRFYTHKTEEHRYRIGVFRNEDVILVFGADLGQYSQDVTRIRNSFLVALPAALTMIAIGAWWLGKHALTPIRALEDDMKRLSARALDQRLEPGKADIEFARIIETYNAMLERLERSFHQANRFSADASHELKTPLAIMRGTLERALSKCETRDDAIEVFSELLEQTGKQGSILESLLLLSRADSGRLEISPEKLDLSDLVVTWIEDAELLAEERKIEVGSEIEPRIFFSGDPLLLQQVAHNAFSNAVRYNREGGLIICALSKTESEIIWTIANTGESIPDQDRERIFERFERASPAIGGAGLGLSLVKEIVAAHEGAVSISETENGMVEFRISFPTT